MAAANRLDPKSPTVGVFFNAPLSLRNKMHKAAKKEGMSFSDAMRDACEHWLNS